MRVNVELGNIKDECFVLMPFASKFDLIYEEVLRPAIEDSGLEAVRADEIYGNKRIMQDVWNGIKSARMVLAELTGRNANVLYELGLAHALGKQTVIVTNTMEDVPFDLKDVRCIVYDKEHPRWGNFLRSNVTRTMRTVLDGHDSDTLYSGIATDAEYPPIAREDADVSRRRAEEAKEAPNVAGEWTLTELWEGELERQTKLFLEQDGTSLRGHATSGTMLAEFGAIVDQEISGYVRDDIIELVATSYQILQPPADGSDISWNLETFRGVLNDDNNFRGEISDKGKAGSFVANRVNSEA